MNPLSNQMSWNSTPLDILSHIYSYLPQNEEILNAISSVCRTWRLGCSSLSQKIFREKSWELFKYQLPHDNETLKIIMRISENNNLIPILLKSSATCNLMSEFSATDVIKSPIEHSYYSDEIYHNIQKEFTQKYCYFDPRFRSRPYEPHKFGPSKNDWERVNYMAFLGSPFKIKWNSKEFKLLDMNKLSLEKSNKFYKNELKLFQKIEPKKTIFKVFRDIENCFITTACNVRVFFLKFYFQSEYYFHNFELNVDPVMDKLKIDSLKENHQILAQALCLEMRTYVSYLSDKNVNNFNLANIDKLLKGEKITLECDEKGIIGTGGHILKISKLIYPGHCPSVIWKLKPGEWEKFISNKLKLEDVLRWSVFSSTCEKLANNLGLELYKNMDDDFG